VAQGRTKLISATILAFVVFFLSVFGFNWAYPRYFLIQLGAPDESVLGSVVAGHIVALATQGAVIPARDAATRFVISFEQGSADSGVQARSCAVKPFSYFRAVAPWRDIRAGVLDRYLRKAVSVQNIRHLARGRWLAFRTDVTEAVIRARLMALIEDSASDPRADILRSLISRLEFRSDNYDPSSRGGSPVVLKISGVSPVVLTSFGLNRGFARVEGFFLAEELVIPGRPPQRRVTYQVARVVRASCVRDLGTGVINWELEIPEKYWAPSSPFGPLELPAEGGCRWTGNVIKEFSWMEGFGSRP
jgi:hypothetical protein